MEETNSLFDKMDNHPVWFVLAAWTLAALGNLLILAGAVLLVAGVLNALGWL